SRSRARLTMSCTAPFSTWSIKPASRERAGLQGFSPTSSRATSVPSRLRPKVPFTLGAPTSSPASTLAHARVLVIDDEPGILNFVSRGLRAEGYQVDVAADGDTGLSAALNQTYDLVILDLLLPGSSGIHLLREMVKRNPEQ